MMVAADELADLQRRLGEPQQAGDDASGFGQFPADRYLPPAATPSAATHQESPRQQRKPQHSVDEAAGEAFGLGDLTSSSKHFQGCSSSAHRDILSLEVCGQTDMAYHRATVSGGSGFLGRQIVKRLALADDGADVGVAVRRPERASFLTEPHRLGIAPVYADVWDAASVVDGSDAVINTAGHYIERGKADRGDSRPERAACPAGIADGGSPHAFQGDVGGEISPPTLSSRECR
jgi:hypothetical protein